MHKQKRINDSVHWYFNDLTSRIVAESRIPSDRFHLGKMILQSCRDAPEFVMQIDGGTGESETNKSALERIIRCGAAFNKYGLKLGDVIVLMAPNHIDLAIPFYAALCLGLATSAIDKDLTVAELSSTFNVSKPKIVFCQSNRATDVQLALNKLDLNAEIVTFDKGDYLCSFTKFLDKNADEVAVGNFKPTNFDPAETTAFLVSTSGTTGVPKAACLTHKNFAITAPYVWSRSTKFPSPVDMALIGSPLQWLTAILNFVLTPIIRMTRLQSSLPITQEHMYHLINTYRPSFTVLSPTFMTTLIKPGDRDRCDFTCFELIMLGGSAVPSELIEEVKKVSPQTEVFNVYGISEAGGIAFQPDEPVSGSCGVPLGCFQYRLVDVDTQEDIVKANTPGELWIKGPGIFKGYYRNPVETKNAFAEGGWFRTGDMLYRDENWKFFFVERIKLLLKYKSHHISPVEVEGVVRQHSGVLDVAVSGVPDPECGDLAVACVVRRKGHRVTAQEIKDLVKDSLTETKQLRGGVIFMDELPLTATTKIHRRKLKEMVLSMPRE